MPLTSADLDNGFGLIDNPYHADLPYDISQGALFGEGSYRFGQFKLTAGGRYYSFKEKRDFISGTPLTSAPHPRRAGPSVRRALCSGA